MASLYISYALNHCSVEYVEDTFNMTFDGDVVQKVTEAIRVDNTTHKPFKMFWIDVLPNRRMKEFLDDINENGCSRLYFKHKGVDHYWNVRLNVPKTSTPFKPVILPRASAEDNALDQVFNDFILTVPIQKRIQEAIEQDKAAPQAFKAAEQKKLVQVAEEVLDYDEALKRFLEKERIDAAKRFDEFMATHGGQGFLKRS